MDATPIAADHAGMHDKNIPLQRLLVAALIALGLAAAIALDRVFDEPDWWVIEAQ